MCMVSNDTFPTCVMFSLSSAIATSDIYSLSLHDALPICGARAGSPRRAPGLPRPASQLDRDAPPRRSDGQRLPRLGETYELAVLLAFDPVTEGQASGSLGVMKRRRAHDESVRGAGVGVVGDPPVP